MKMVTIGNLELPSSQAKKIIERLSPRTRNNIIRRKMGLPPGESDDDIVQVGLASCTRAQAEKIISRMSPEEKNKIIERRMKKSW